MSTPFEPKSERGIDKDAYDSLATLLVYYIEDNIKDMPQSVEQRLKLLDKEWAEQGEL
jgi:hypothetical protein